ncbi:MAG: hypothetical protein PHD48_04400 [Alphaproteobacteria bacterium]|nr:hypothetical protein [Alphaproteobacteria bacterium]
MRKVRIPYLLPFGLVITGLLTSCSSKHTRNTQEQPHKPTNGKSLEQLYKEYPCEGSPICGRHAVLYAPLGKDKTNKDEESSKFIGAITPPIPVGKKGKLTYRMFVFPEATTFDNMNNTPISQIPFPDATSAVGFQKKLSKLVETAREVVKQKGGNLHATADTMTKVADTLIDISDKSAPIAIPTLESMIQAIKVIGAPTNEIK